MDTQLLATTLENVKQKQKPTLMLGMDYTEDIMDLDTDTIILWSPLSELSLHTPMAQLSQPTHQQSKQPPTLTLPPKLPLLLLMAYTTDMVIWVIWDIMAIILANVPPMLKLNHGTDGTDTQLSHPSELWLLTPTELLSQPIPPIKLLLLLTLQVKDSSIGVRYHNKPFSYLNHPMINTSPEPNFLHI